MRLAGGTSTSDLHLEQGYVSQIVTREHHPNLDNMHGKNSLEDNLHDNKPNDLGDRNHLSLVNTLTLTIIDGLKTHASFLSKGTVPTPRERILFSYSASVWEGFYEGVSQ